MSLQKLTSQSSQEEYDEVIDPTYDEGADPEYDEGAQPDYDNSFSDDSKEDAGSQEWYARKQK